MGLSSKQTLWWGLGLQEWDAQAILLLQTLPEYGLTFAQNLDEIGSAVHAVLNDLSR